MPRCPDQPPASERHRPMHHAAHRKAEPQTATPVDDPVRHQHVARWLAHVAAQRIGPFVRPNASLLEAGNPGTTPAQLLAHHRNEQTLLGPVAARTVRFAAGERGR